MGVPLTREVDSLGTAFRMFRVSDRQASALGCVPNVPGWIIQSWWVAEVPVDLYQSGGGERRLLAILCAGTCSGTSPLPVPALYSSCSFPFLSPILPGSAVTAPSPKKAARS